MLTLAQLGSHVKRQSVPNHLINKESPSDSSTYRFIRVRGGSFRSRFNDNRIQLEDTSNVRYDFRGLSAVSTDEQTCAQFKVALFGGLLPGNQPSCLNSFVLLSALVYTLSSF